MKNIQAEAIIFDLDGTLLNSLEDIADTANEVLEHFGFAIYPVEMYIRFVGNGLRKLIERIMPENSDEATLLQGITEFKKRYERNWRNKTVPYPFIMETLHTLMQKDISIAILSNKPDIFTKECTQFFFPEIKINPVMGQVDAVAPKPSAEGALLISQILKIAPDKCIFVGDSDIDIQTGIAAGMKTVGVAWGFRGEQELRNAGADIVINQPQELLHYV